MFEELLEKLENCSHVQYEASAYFVRILPTTPAGFPVMIEWMFHSPFSVAFRLLRTIGCPTSMKTCLYCDNRRKHESRMCGLIG